MSEIDEFSFFALFDMIVATSATTAEKFITLIHARQISRKNGVSHLSRSTAQAQASVSDDTYQRALPVVRVFFQDTPSRGRATVWRARPDITSQDIEAAIISLRDTAKPYRKTIPQNAVYRKTIPQEQGPTTPQNAATPYRNERQHKDQSKDQIEKYSEPSSDGSGAEAPALTAREIIWKDGLKWLRENSPMTREANLRSKVGEWIRDHGDEETLSAIRRATKAKPGSPVPWIERLLLSDAQAHSHVRRVGSKLEVFNGFETELAGILAGRDLGRALARIAGRVPVHVRGVELEARVRALAVEMVDQASEQDRRYAAAAESGKSAKQQIRVPDSIYDGVL